MNPISLLTVFLAPHEKIELISLSPHSSPFCSNGGAQQDETGMMEQQR